MQRGDIVSRFVVIGNPDNRRIALFQAALHRSRLPTATIVPYLDLLTARQHLENIIQAGDIIRIESPGEDFAVEQQFIALGADGAKTATNYEHGRIYYPRQWYQGFSAFLRQMQTSFENLRQAGTDFTLMNAPLNILTMFDKRHCHQLCHENNLPVPPSFNAIGSYEQLREVMTQTGQRRVFVKLAYGSSASGVVAYEIDGRGEREQAHTSVELTYRQAHPILYNSLKIKRYKKHHQIKAIIDWLCHEGVHVEHWLPKAHHKGQVYDLRVVVIAGRARHRVVRLSHTPLTNLHLGNARASANELKLSEQLWQNIENTAERGAALFPESLYAGLDIMLPLRSQTPVILEINAFGDLLPGISHDGMDTYQAELSQIK
jgi:glutathione synthase/RimK-type ligase-like ATP-grasp enzyme